MIINGITLHCWDELEAYWWLFTIAKNICLYNAVRICFYHTRVRTVKQKVPKKLKKRQFILITLFSEMSSDREQNGPTQVHPALNYNDLTSHMQLNGLNGINGIGMMSKPFAERGKLLLDQIQWSFYLKLEFSNNFESWEKSRDGKFSNDNEHARFSSEYLLALSESPFQKTDQILQSLSLLPWSLMPWFVSQ